MPTNVRVDRPRRRNRAQRSDAGKWSDRTRCYTADNASLFCLKWQQLILNNSPSEFCRDGLELINRLLL